MTVLLLDPGDALLQAASLAFALIRFEAGAAHPDRRETIPGMLRIGEEACLFIPSRRPVPHAEVPAFLAGLPSPALLSPTTTRGIVALTLLGELSGERAASAGKIFTNQRAGLERMVGELGLADDARVLLEFDDETHLVSIAAMRVWSERFAVQVMWSLGTLDPDGRADMRLHLRRSDGKDSWGRSCPVHHLR
jgi:hypothetical protein